MIQTQRHVVSSAGFAKIRTEETNASNWIADIIRDGTAADVTILNSGTLRADELIPVGLYRYPRTRSFDSFALIPVRSD